MCPNGHPTPIEFAPGIQIRCPYTKDGINCDAIYTVGQGPVKAAPAATTVTGAGSRRIG